MNELVAKLAEQAGQLSFDSENELNLIVSTDDSSYEVPANFIEKFAELIVKECMELCKKQEYDYWRSSEDQDFTPIDCADAIKEHFGVEE
jgi:chorismate mutase